MRPALANIQSLNPHLLPTWADFVAFCEWHVECYNNRPHRSLPKILDVAGIKRHMTPNEMWALKVGKKKCCRSKKRCKTCPVVLHRLRKSGALKLDDKALAKALANARKW